jgi:hypothetical protein
VSDHVNTTVGILEDAKRHFTAVAKASAAAPAGVAQPRSAQPHPEKAQANGK